MKRTALAALFSLLMLVSFGATAAPVDVNTADAATLAKAISGVGPARAEAIVAYRNANGPFKSIDEITKVKGIGPSVLEANRGNLTVSAK